MTAAAGSESRAARAAAPEYNVDDAAHPFRPYGATWGTGWSGRGCWSTCTLPSTSRWPGCWTTRRRCSALRWRRAGTSTALRVWSTPWTGPASRSSGNGCTGWSPRQPAPPRFSPASPATLPTASGRSGGGTTPNASLSTDARQLAPRARPQQQSAATVWPGKPDVYHAFHATILTRAPLASSVGAAALAMAESGESDR